MAAGRYNLDDLISHEFNFTDIREAFSLAGDPSQDKMKYRLRIA